MNNVRYKIKWLCIAIIGATMNLGSHAALIASIGGDYASGGVPANYNYAYSTTAIVGNTRGTALTQGIAVGDAGNVGYGVTGNTTPALLGSLNGGTEFEILNTGFQNNAGVAGTDILMLGTAGTARYMAIQYTITQQDIDANGNRANIMGSFRRLATGGDGIHIGVYHNAASVFNVQSNITGSDMSLTAADGSFNVMATVAAGDIITWVVDFRTDAIDDEVAMNGLINLVPEPETYALIFGGIALGFAMIRRRIKG